MPKFGVLKSIGHNMAASLASGVGLPVGYVTTDVFAEAARGPEGHVTVDFLSGRAAEERISEPLALAIVLYARFLPDLCRRHGVDFGDLRELTARYWRVGSDDGFSVTVEDRSGRRCADEFSSSGARIKVRDSLGRIRPKQVDRADVCLCFRGP